MFSAMMSWIKFLRYPAFITCLCHTHLIITTFKILYVVYRLICQIWEFSYSLISLPALAPKSHIGQALIVTPLLPQEFDPGDLVINWLNGGRLCLTSCSLMCNHQTSWVKVYPEFRLSAVHQNTRIRLQELLRNRCCHCGVTL